MPLFHAKRCGELRLSQDLGQQVIQHRIAAAGDAHSSAVIQNPFGKRRFCIFFTRTGDSLETLHVYL